MNDEGAVFGVGAAPFVTADTKAFRARLLDQVHADPAYTALTKTEQKYLDQMIGLANEGGEIHVKHDELVVLVGQCRRNVIRVLQRLVDKGLLTVGARYRWVIKTSKRGKPYRMKMRLPNVYRIANRFMTALKRAGKLIRHRIVTAVKPSLVEQEEVLLSAPESFGICRSRWRKMYALGIDRCRGCWRKLRYRNLRYLVRSRLLHLEPVW